MFNNEGPSLLGVCEVENESVLKRLADRLNIPGRDYAVVPHASDDARGIDTSFIIDRNELEVLETDRLKLLVCDGVIQTAVPISGVKLVPGVLIRARDYVELIPYYRPGTRTALLIGLGGGLHAQALACHRIMVRAVDIEPAVVPLAEEHFGFVGEVTISVAIKNAPIINPPENK